MQNPDLTLQKLLRKAPVNYKSTPIELVRFLRNILEHLDNYKDIFQNIDVFFKWLYSCFPNLVMDCWTFMRFYKNFSPAFKPIVSLYLPQ